ncbi:MAG TPA: helix-turn-helix domain-containing protein [Candidatus Dormibacteraeota bacterium]|nr:helix-turn-helix domain-containing protein [Candidatus Dormibacteraeota bacterium]
MIPPDTVVDQLRRDAQAEEERALRAREEVSALQEVATEILSVRDSTEVLLSITHTALRLLSADIAGVFLRDGDEMVMRSCAGQRSQETARLRMTRGQGLAGRVMQTARPVQVDDYVHAEVISDDFIPLAQMESVRSALGAPLTVRGDIIGVLEVWRRRRSVFAQHEVRRLVAMADLVTIAIENARLNDSQATSMRRLETAYESLEAQVDATRRSTVTQRTLVQLLLEGAGLPAIARSLATLTGERVAILSTTLEPLATHPRDLDVVAVRNELRRHRHDRNGGGPAPVRLRDGGGWLLAHPIQAAGDSFGHVCLIAEETPGDVQEIATGQAALVCALHHLEQRAADEARADARDEIIWDLLHGSDEYQRAAARRAERLHIDLRRPHRVFCCTVQDLDAVAGLEGTEPARTERARHQVRRILQRVSAQHGGPDLVSLRGNAMVAVAPCGDPASARALARAATEQMSAVLPGLVTRWGVSRPHANPLEYRVAYREATLAMRVAARPGQDEVVAVFDELGVTRLLLAPGDQPDLADYVKEVLGPVLEYDRERSTPLITTLRAYLECDCSLNAAAMRLAVHHKTLRYRLNRIHELTALDLRRHEDRFRADLALRILQLSAPA